MAKSTLTIHDVSSPCKACRTDGPALPPFSIAFQPIVDTEWQTVYAYEALARAPHSSSSASLFEQISPEQRYLFDQTCRIKAIQAAARLGIGDSGAKLSVNFMPGAVYSPAACIRKTLQAAREFGFPLDALIFEITEDERIEDIEHIQAIITEYHRHGFRIALDDYGAAYSGLNLLSQIDADIVKLDKVITRNLHLRPRAQALVRHFAAFCLESDILVVGEGVETVEEYLALRHCGVYLMQGYLFAPPAEEKLPVIHWPLTLAA